MAVLKHKSDASGSKKRKNGAEDRRSVTKRSRAEPSARTASKPERTEAQDENTKATMPSVLQQEERMFPRGGASVLTPLEHKQIRIEATRDVLFEESGKKRQSKARDDEENVEGGATRRPTKKRKTKDTKEHVASQEKSSVKIEGLSYKKLIPGSLVLGQVSQINANDVSLALPNNLTGYIPLTAISQKITQKLEALVADNDNDESGAEDNDIDLRSIFIPGQYLKACVMSTIKDSSDKAQKGKKHIDLSVDPRQANRGLARENLIVNSMVQASVKSIEDHGLVMELGIEDNSIKGFMSSKELGPAMNITKVQEGAVFLCLVTGLSSNGRIVKLSADHRRAGNLKKGNFVVDAPTIDAFMPGTAVEMLVSEASTNGVIGQVMGMLNATADIIHSVRNETEESVQKKYRPGNKAKARVLFKLPDSDSDSTKIGVSLLDHVVSLSPRTSAEEKVIRDPLELLPLSSFVDQAKVVKVQPGIGLFMDIAIRGIQGFAHISRLADTKIETLLATTGAFREGSVHRARVIGYNAMDGLFLLSLEPKILAQPFLRIEDVEVGSIVPGKVDKLILGPKGVTGVLINLAEGITGLVPETHMADVYLQNPEKKFREGAPVKARVLSTDPDKRQLRLTLKKTLVNSDASVWKNYKQISVGDQSQGSIVNILPTGAVVQFYGNVRAFLPVAEMSEAYIQDPSQHFRIGQVVSVHVLSVDPEQEKMKVSCKDASALSEGQRKIFDQTHVGGFVQGTITGKSEDDVVLDVQCSGDSDDLKAILKLGQLTDESEKAERSALKRLRVGQPLQDLLVIEKLEKRATLVLSNKKKMAQAAKDGMLITKFEDVREGQMAHGFVRNITPEGVYVQFGGGVVGLMLRNHTSTDARALPNFGLRKDQSVSLHVLNVDHQRRRFLLTMEKPKPSSQQEKPEAQRDTHEKLINPVDETVQAMDDFQIGTRTKARITSVKDTQLNVELAENVPGRIDVSEVFTSWEQIQNRKHPLRQFKPGQILDVRILGVHDARSHRFLPISHRSGKVSTFELTAKSADKVDLKEAMLTIDRVSIGSSWVTFVNNIASHCLWVNLSPNVRGRVELMDIADDLSLLNNLATNFAVGSALRVRVKSVDVSTNHLDLTARTKSDSTALTWDKLSIGLVMPGRVTKVTEHSVMVQLSEAISGPVPLTELADDFVEANPQKFKKNEMTRVCIVHMDTSNKKIILSTRPSKVLSSSLPVIDPSIMEISQIKTNDVVRGFIKNVSDKGLFVSLSFNITAFIKVADLSDSYLRDWKLGFQVDQLVKGKITSVDVALNQVQMTLKESVLNKDYIPPIAFNDIKKGQIVTGKVRKVEDFGVFIVVDGSNNVSGLCHKTEVADRMVGTELKKLYSEGDAVKAFVLKVDPEKRKISFSLKASYFKVDHDSHEERSEDEESDDVGGVALSDAELSAGDDEGMPDRGVELQDVPSIDGSQAETEDESSGDEMQLDRTPQTSMKGLSVGGFDWSGGTALDQGDKVALLSEADTDEEAGLRKKKRRKPQVKVDKTGDLDKYGPQSVADYERSLLASPNSSSLWVQYMAFQLQLGEVDKAREIAERALRTIHITETEEKMNVWIAWLNLENAYGTEEGLEEVFKRACQYNDAETMHERLTSIFIESGKIQKADTLLQTMTKTKTFTSNPNLWLNYAHFLFTALDSPSRARALLTRAMQSVPPHEHLRLTARFAALEYHIGNGDPERGRTVFEGLVSAFPKRWDVWDQWVDLEKGLFEREMKSESTTRPGEKGSADGRTSIENVKGLYERMTGCKMKQRRAKFVFKKWLQWEEKWGDDKSRAAVTALAREWVARSKDEKERGGKEDDGEE